MLLIDTCTNFITIYTDDQCLEPKKLAECSTSKTSESSLQGNNNLKSREKRPYLKLKTVPAHLKVKTVPSELVIATKQFLVPLSPRLRGYDS